MTDNVLECDCGSTDFELFERGKLGPQDYLGASCSECGKVHATLVSEGVSGILSEQLGP
jgi:hypothetical protein